MNELQRFEFVPCTTMRALTIDGNPWFVAKDVCEVLGLDTTNVRRRLREKDAMVVKLTGIRGQGSLVITEPGLYRLINRSTKPEAERFQDWVTDVVLPAIRKDWAYIVGEEKVATGEMSEEELVHKALGILDRKTKRLTQELEVTTAAKLKYQQRSSGLEPVKRAHRHPTHSRPLLQRPWP